MKIVFAGTPEFAAFAMRAILDAGHEIVLALTQPDRRSGRGMHLQASPVKIVANEKNIPILQVVTLKQNHPNKEKSIEAQEAFQYLSKIDFDVMVVVAYGLILPQDILDLAEKNGRHGCFNIHASLLPRWRGAAPIQRAIESGDRQTGVSIMQMDAGLDTGDVVLKKELAISSEETSASLYDRLAKLGAALMLETLTSLEQGKSLMAIPQPQDGVTYAEKIQKSEAEIDWHMSAEKIDCCIRAFNPFPGSTSNLNGEPMKLWNSRPSDNQSILQTKKPGEILGLNGDSVLIQCGQGVIEVLEMQKPGGKKLAASVCLGPEFIGGAFG